MQGLIIIVNMLVNKNRDYSIDDCYKLHESIEKYVVPILKQLGSISKKNLGVKRIALGIFLHVIYQKSHSKM